MERLTRRELLAWLAAGTATTAAGFTLLPGGGDAASAPSAGPGTTSGGTRPNGSAAPRTTAAGSMPAPATASEPVRAADGDRLLVVVEMPGGNDGMSMVVPHGVPGYYDVRPQLAIAPGDVLAIDDLVGFHPNLAGVARRGAAAVVGVGSHEPDGSHFEMMQRWWAGDPRAGSPTTGWVGRLADVLDDRDALATAITVGTGSHPILRSERAATLAIPGADAAWYLSGAEGGVELAFQRGVAALGSAGGDGYAGRLAATTGRTVDLAGRLVDGDGDDVDGYPDTELGRSLRFARELFTLGAGVRVVHVVMSGDFDTHDGHGDRHPALMQTFDDAVTAFWDDVDASGLAGRVALMTTSEFGRTVHENGSLGLDHGAASSMLVMGPVAAGRVGEHPSLTALDDNDDLMATAGLDQYLGAMVEGWLGVPADEVFPSRPELLPIPFT